MSFFSRRASKIFKSSRKSSKPHTDPDLKCQPRSTSPPSEQPPPYTPTDPASLPSDPVEAQSLQRARTFRDAPSKDPYAALSKFDTVFLIDDSGSMAGSNWSQTSAAISAIAPICTRYDSDGIDIHFLNSSVTGSHLTTSSAVISLFSSIRPRGATPTGARLGELLRAYIDAYQHNPRLKPLNIICITDGEPTDPNTLEKNIVWAAKQLDRLKAPQRQVGVQFFQVGTDEAATEALEELDNALVEEHGIRDMVDTVSWKDMNKGGGLTGEGVLKAVMGAVDRGLDRKRKF